MLKLIEYKGFDEYINMFEKLKSTYRNEIIYQIFDTATYQCWDLDCFEDFKAAGFKAFMKLFKFNQDYTLHAQANANMIAFALTSAAKTFIRLVMPRMPGERLMAPKAFKPRDKIRLLNELYTCINDFEYITQHHDDEFSLNFIKDDHFIFCSNDVFITRIQCQMVLAMALHKRLGQKSHLYGLSQDVIHCICLNL